MRILIRRRLRLAAFSAILTQPSNTLAQTTSSKLVRQTNDIYQSAWVNVSSEASTNLFNYEQLQFTDDVLANLDSVGANAKLFDFGNSVSNASTTRSLSGECKTFPGDELWPSTNIWNSLDMLLGGALIKTVPLASPCYQNWGNYDADLCDVVTANWSTWAYMQTDDPTSVNAELYQTSSCLPPDVFPYDANCSLGSYPPYSVNVSNVAQIQLALNFARNLDLRLVVKNTGHDFNAKSTGAGALAIWTHNLKDTNYFDEYTTPEYSGPAFKLGAGIQGYELYAACHEKNVTCVGGEGRTVGMMGGFVQGGGHSPLSSFYGMGADQILGFEVVTADGRLVTASEDENQDLFWALRGGGGGTFGVVTSAVVKVYPKLPCSYLTFVITRSGNVTEEMFWAAARAYWDDFVTWTNAGTYSYFYMYPAGMAGLEVDSWMMMPWFAPNMTQAQLEDLVAPLFAKFSSLGLSVTPSYAEFDNFYDAWDTAFPLEFWGINVGRQAGRFFPYENWDNATILTASFEAVKSVFQDGAYIYGFHMAPGGPLVTYPDNAVNPAWRKTVGHIMLGSSWTASDWANETGIAKIAEFSYNTTNVWADKWRKVAPNSGSYCSESDYLEPDFQQSLWGNNYQRLYEIKQKYDPTGLFYARRAVGSESWETDEEVVPGLPSQAGRLCRV